MGNNLLVYGNGDRLFQLVMILGDNAMKYSPDSSAITFQVTANSQHETVLVVADQGFGIPEEDIPYIWERFYKADKSHSRHIAGTGLGLAIGKEIIRMHKAKAQVQSKVGKGTRFTITFPSYEPDKRQKEDMPDVEVVENMPPLSAEPHVEEETYEDT